MIDEKQFNTAGPCKQDKHYIIDPLVRIDYLELVKLIENERYFVLHAPRQTGKTTSLLALVKYLNATGLYRAVYANIEGGQAMRHQVEAGIDGICSVIAHAVRREWGDESLWPWFHEQGRHIPVADRLSHFLEYLTTRDSRPLVLMLDEVDALVGDTLIALLRQLRSGYPNRPRYFPQSIILCGVRDIRDYRIHTSHQEIITGGSAFNIKAESLRVGNFTRLESEALWLQHTQATGQSFAPEIFDELWQDSVGQPWLVNALGHQLIYKNHRLRDDRSIAITLEDYFAARESLIQSRATHLDQLVDKLREPRVHKVIAPLLLGEESANLDISPDDQQYVEDMGLIRTWPEVCIANRIYAEVIPRELTWVAQTHITQKNNWYIKSDRRLDTPKLLAAFQQFYREHSDSWLKNFEYKEAGPQLLLQAFLQRIVNGGGRIDREYGLGKKRTDLYIQWPLDEQQGYYGPIQRVVLELKLRRGTLESVLEPGLEQTREYALRCGADEAHLILFDCRPQSTWEERIWQEDKLKDGMTIRVWGA